MICREYALDGLTEGPNGGLGLTHHWTQEQPRSHKRPKQKKIQSVQGPRSKPETGGSGARGVPMFP